MYNIFRIVGDFLHLFSFVALILKIRKSKNCNGLSAKAQELYLVVFLTRYLDIFYRFEDQTFYLATMKILFISATAYTLYLMRYEKPSSLTYDPLTDAFPHWQYLVPGALVMALIIHRDWSFFDYLWSFSIWLESVAIFPQIHMLSKRKEVENITAHYMGSLGFYRIFYILNWIWRYFAEGYVCWTSVLGGLLQAGIYADFLYVYIKGIKDKDFIIRV